MLIFQSKDAMLSMKARLNRKLNENSAQADGMVEAEGRNNKLASMRASLPVSLVASLADDLEKLIKLLGGEVRIDRRDPRRFEQLVDVLFQDALQDVFKLEKDPGKVEAFIETHWGQLSKVLPPALADNKCCLPDIGICLRCIDDIMVNQWPKMQVSYRPQLFAVVEMDAQSIPLSPRVIIRGKAPGRWRAEKLQPVQYLEQPPKSSQSVVLSFVCRGRDRDRQIFLHQHEAFGKERYYSFAEDFPYDDDPMPGDLADQRNLGFPLEQ
eukprot:4034929-Amphidinium_carterae.1